MKEFNQEKWIWMMDWCGGGGLSPALAFVWRKAEDEWAKREELGHE